MRINSEVNVPDALIKAQRDGKLVVFAGAGVSMGPPSNLPSFDDLAQAVSGGRLSLSQAEPLDAFLGRLEVAQVDIQGRTRQHLDIGVSTPRVIHHRIVNLFRSENDVRLVTTNFDRHF